MNETREEGYDVFLLKRKHVSEKMMTTKACEKIKRSVHAHWWDHDWRSARIDCWFFHGL